MLLASSTSCSDGVCDGVYSQTSVSRGNGLRVGQNQITSAHVQRRIVLNERSARAMSSLDDVKSKTSTLVTGGIVLPCTVSQHSRSTRCESNVFLKDFFQRTVFSPGSSLLARCHVHFCCDMPLILGVQSSRFHPRNTLKPIGARTERNTTLMFSDSSVVRVLRDATTSGALRDTVEKRASRGGADGLQLCCTIHTAHGLSVYATSFAAVTPRQMPRVMDITVRQHT